jgi:hypothetical protein
VRNFIKVALAATAFAATASLPAAAQELNATQASRFVVGKVFAFTCYDGTTGSGRVFADGSAAGSVNMQGKGPARFMSVPPGTLRIQNDEVCASLKGLMFQPCFDVVQTSTRTFKGSVQGMDFAFCNFTRRGGRGDFAGEPGLPGTQTASGTNSRRPE